MMEASETTGAVSLVQVWGKGYRVTEDSEEFQRCVPTRGATVSPLEKSLAALSWGPILEPLYKMNDRDLGVQRCILFDAHQLMALSFAKSEDSHGRPSVVLATAATDISWRSPQLGLIAARSVRLAGRLGSAYAEAFHGNPKATGEQLREGAFLPSRGFEIDKEEADTAIEWPGVITAVKRWRGITGVATPRVLTLGANVALGTRHEAERARKQTRVDGYYDVREKGIAPLSAALTPWEEPHVAPIIQTGEEAAGPTIEPTVHSLNRIADTLDALADIGREILHLLGGERRKK
jgi:hypothetical protein